MIRALPDESARLIGAGIVTGWGMLVMALGTVVWTNFHGVAERGVRLARLGRHVEPMHRRNSVRAYRRRAGLFVVVGAATILLGLAGFVFAAL